MTTPIHAVIDRLLKVEEEDRELDLAIYEALGASKPVGYSQHWTSPDGRTQHYESLIPHYTGSFDAALKLLPAGAYWIIGNGRDRATEPLGSVEIFKPVLGAHDVVAETEHASPIIAICIAGLRARAGIPPAATEGAK